MINNIHKKLLQSILFCLLAFVLCSCSLTTKALNNYIKTGNSNNGIINSLQTATDENSNKLEVINNTFKELGIDLSEDGSNSYNLEQLIIEMNELNKKISETVLIEGNTVTSEGKTLLKAVCLENDVKEDITTNIRQAIADTVKNSIAGNTTDSAGINFVDSSTGSNQYSDVDCALTLFGYEVSDKAIVKIYYADDNDTLSYVTDINMLRNNIENISSKQLKINTNTELNQNQGLYKFEFEDLAKKLSTDLDIEGLFVNDAKHKIALTLRDIENPTYSSVINDINNYTKEIRNKDGTIKREARTIKQWLSEGNRGEELNTLLHYYGCIGVLDNLELIKSNLDEHKAGSAEYAVAEIYGLDINLEAKSANGINGNGSNVIGYVTIEVSLTYKGKDSTHFDLSVYANKDTADACKNAYNLLPPDTNKKALVDALTSNNEAQLVMLKSDITIDTANINTDTTSLTNTALYEPVTDVSGQPVKISLFDNLNEGALTDTETVPLYVGNVEIGELYINTFSDNIIDATNAKIIGNNGAVSNSTIQKFKSYTANNKTYILYGLYDVGIIDNITAKLNNDGSHTYLINFENSSLLYNIFDNKIYQYGSDNKASATFDTTGGVQLYTVSDLTITNKIDSQPNCKYAADFINSTGSSDDFKDVTLAIQNHRSPFVLRTYLEGLYLPNQYFNEKFVCLGRKVIFSDFWFNKDAVINENTPAFSISTPTEGNEYASSSQHTVGELLSSTLRQKDGYNSDGLVRLDYQGQEDVKRNNAYYDTIETVNTYFLNKIYRGEFKTQDKMLSKEESLYGEYAQREKGIYAKWGIYAPRLFVWCTKTDVNKALAEYIKGPEFNAWRTWLDANGYENYLKDTIEKGITEDLVYKLEQQYDLSLNTEEAGSELVIDVTGLEELQDWVNKQIELDNNSILNVILRTIGIILLAYGMLLIISYVIDVAIAGEGEGLLKKVTFGRMRSVAGLSREEKDRLIETNHTYSTRAVSLIDILPIVFVFWVASLLLLTNLSYGLIDKLIDTSNTLTSAIKNALGNK